MSDYEVKGHYFENQQDRLKKGLQEGRLTLLPDNKLIGEISDLDYPEKGKRIVLGVYDQNFPCSIHFIKTVPLFREPKQSFIYSLASESLVGEDISSIYRGYWLGVEPYETSLVNGCLGIPPIANTLSAMVHREFNEDTVKIFENVSYDFLMTVYFNEEVLKRLDGLSWIIGQRGVLGLTPSYQNP